MIKQLRDKLKEKLDTLTGTWQPLSVVYDHMEIKPSWYPCAMIDFNNLWSEYADSCNNKNIINFNIYIMQETAKKIRNDAIDDIEDIIYKIINLLNTDTTLWWTVNNILPVWWDVSEYTNWNNWEYIWGIVSISIEDFYFLW